MKTVAVFVGSVRKGSVNRMLAEAVAEIAADRMAFRFVKIDDLPLYNHDLWEDEPAEVARMKGEVADCDAVLVVGPEYNRFFSPLIKNAVDWCSKPFDDNVLTGKPAAAMGATPGALGAMGGVMSTVQLLNVVGCRVMATPSVYFLHRDDKYDGGKLVEEDARALLGRFVDAFDEWLARF